MHLDKLTKLKLGHPRMLETKKSLLRTWGPRFFGVKMHFTVNVSFLFLKLNILLVNLHFWHKDYVSNYAKQCHQFEKSTHYTSSLSSKYYVYLCVVQ